MKSNKEILDEFGKKVTLDIYDDGLRYFKQILSFSTKWEAGKEYSDILNKLPSKDQRIIEKYIKEILSTSLFAFLKVFEDNEQFKLIYEEKGQQVDLNRISEMLKSEPIIEGGWIERFSKESKNDRTN